MNIKAIEKYIKVSPQKTKVIIDSIKETVKKKGIKETLEILRFIPNKPAKLIREAIKSAVANAKDKNEEDLYIKELFVTQGPILKPYRWEHAARGRATKIRKRTSHITVILEEKGEK